MNVSLSKTITQGHAGRYLKPSWVSNGDVSINAFDLRLNRQPPEEYISFFEIQGDCDRKRLSNAYLNAKKIMSIKSSGFIAIFSINEVLLLINQNRNIVWFTDEKLPHLGLHYSKKASPQEILEAKNFLSWLARKKLNKVHTIENDLLPLTPNQDKSSAN